MAVTGMPKGSRLIQIIIAVILILLGLYTLSSGWGMMPGPLRFEHSPAKMASLGAILLGIGLIFLQGMSTFEQKPGIYNLCMMGFYAAGGLGAVMVIMAFWRRAASG